MTNTPRTCTRPGHRTTTVDLRSTLVADGWTLHVEPPDSSGVIGAYRVGAGCRDFIVTGEKGNGVVFGGRWFAASNLTWIRQVDGCREMTRLLDAFPDEPAAPWIPVDADELLAMTQQRQAELTRTPPPPDRG
ncbi:hypothetical protein [Actinokineospora spheciospongiae]|uniref:hypothetical protein n=1 Tax=Actinokineospora spheciospongiae TaxID=909613 RepID=UPI00126967C4|nr:hypothetical protein [Actinokineospora spheciospongiae]